MPWQILLQFLLERPKNRARIYGSTHKLVEPFEHTPLALQVNTSTNKPSVLIRHQRHLACFLSIRHSTEARRGEVSVSFASSSRARPSGAPAAAVRRTRRPSPSTSRRAPRKISACRNDDGDKLYMARLSRGEIG